MYPHGSQYAFGIDENTALVVTGPWKCSTDGTKKGRVAEVLGESGVTVFDMTEAVVSSLENDHENEDRWTLQGLIVSHMTRGDAIDLQSYSVIPADFKTSLEVNL